MYFEGALDVGTYYYDDPAAHRNGEFDVTILRPGGVDIIEAKYWSGPVDKQEVFKEKEQISRVEELTVAKIGFVSISGFDPDVTGLDYKIDGEDLYR